MRIRLFKQVLIDYISHSSCLWVNARVHIQRLCGLKEKKCKKEKPWIVAMQFSQSRWLNHWGAVQSASNKEFSYISRLVRFTFLEDNTIAVLLSVKKLWRWLNLKLCFFDDDPTFLARYALSETWWKRILEVMLYLAGNEGMTIVGRLLMRMDVLLLWAQRWLWSSMLWCYRELAAGANYMWAEHMLLPTFSKSSFTKC